MCLRYRRSHCQNEFCKNCCLSLNKGGCSFHKSGKWQRCLASFVKFSFHLTKCLPSGTKYAKHGVEAVSVGQTIFETLNSRRGYHEVIRLGNIEFEISLFATFLWLCFLPLGLINFFLIFRIFCRSTASYGLYPVTQLHESAGAYQSMPRQ